MKGVNETTNMRPPSERQSVLTHVGSLIRQDVRRMVADMNDEGWDPAEAAEATVEWWVRQVLIEALEGARDAVSMEP